MFLPPATVGIHLDRTNCCRRKLHRDPSRRVAVHRISKPVAKPATPMPPQLDAGGVATDPIGIGVLVSRRFALRLRWASLTVSLLTYEIPYQFRLSDCLFDCIARGYNRLILLPRYFGMGDPC